ncbi:hypothetical protein NFHSH190041_34180 [Shewanella sp. NFH-SH190041]|uniref:DUF4145 domain-containing protein n=1 Tax=Shewanella sp. NFH-SH190041 TaxID=2950245 RepID=UPI0021C29754|nr:DUF4145 domain-containing protein [Shewanella sp. NFH-SH190041]BDM65966.1 hypothetical protein NFHSH190041_34180 [Shewanella sp. NFH-SH190041]
MTDTDFVRDLVPELLADYQDAKGYAADVPTQSLLHIRALAHRLTRRLAADRVSFTSPNLYERIEQLNQQRLIDVPTARALHKLRGHGNRGAHPEKYHLTKSQLQTLAQKAIRDCLSLLEHLYYKWHRKPAPTYEFEQAAALSAKELCYRAVMQDDAEARYLVGMSLKAKALMELEQEQAQALDEEDRAPQSHSAATFSQAAYWFELAAPAHHGALFEHGVALLHGYRGQAEPAAGEALIAEAAGYRLPAAQALLGYFYLVGGHSISADELQAEKYLTQAAEAGNSEAMSNLGVLWYQRGELDKAFGWISRAARSGFANAQYHLALMLAQGEGCDADTAASEHWLAEAAEHGQLDAMLERARHMLNDEQAFGSDLSEAENYLRQVIRFGHSVPAMLELSIALADGMLGRIDVVGAAALLKLARSLADDEQLAVIRPLWASLLEQIQRVTPLSQDPGEQKSLRRAQELLSED